MRGKRHIAGPPELLFDRSESCAGGRGGKEAEEAEEDAAGFRSCSAIAFSGPFRRTGQAPAHPLAGAPGSPTRVTSFPDQLFQAPKRKKRAVL